MSELERLFMELDTNCDGFIDKMSFKRIINILDLPIHHHKISKENSYDDLVEYIQIFSQSKRQYIRISDLKDILSEELDSESVEYMLKDVYNRSKIGQRVDLNKLMENLGSSDLFNLD